MQSQTLADVTGLTLVLQHVVRAPSCASQSHSSVVGSSIAQVLLHPSPENTLPSSHSSPPAASRTPSPQGPG